jgi:hypothetical protein
MRIKVHWHLYVENSNRHPAYISKKQSRLPPNRSADHSQQKRHEAAGINDHPPPQKESKKS